MTHVAFDDPRMHAALTDILCRTGTVSGDPVLLHTPDLAQQKSRGYSEVLTAVTLSLSLATLLLGAPNIDKLSHPNKALSLSASRRAPSSPTPIVMAEQPDKPGVRFTARGNVEGERRGTVVRAMSQGKVERATRRRLSSERPTLTRVLDSPRYVETERASKFERVPSVPISIDTSQTENHPSSPTVNRHGITQNLIRPESPDQVAAPAFAGMYSVPSRLERRASVDAVRMLRRQ